MTFEEIVDQALAMLERRGRVAYRTLKRQFQLDDDALEDLKIDESYLGLFKAYNNFKVDNFTNKLFI